ncbi:tellurite resistance/C4-dicarboxylate transporter family protein [Streptomyces gibsoniae]|uniref:Tellurite resistance/C4-dicarboxylate transporter family protein n=1 Tax=Streptomyces gibsoniae TaxID=3075529 RepID=A0ABU2TLG6_9ACTN|nr:tellurite resistance/C4-dicarboxylate transporter family protein [Streptomyces sp. DSM 41699]MDT0461785.1 tellurite resistance/C4-dicarboxylate transporter family protein [Streptomyces sp. DSM 41699]
MSGTSALRTRWAQRPPATGAAVMATGILSIGLHQTGYELLSRIALLLAGVAWLGVAAVIALRLLGARLEWPVNSPAALAVVPATTVLGTRFSLLGRQQLAEALFVLALVLWAVLVLPAVQDWERGMPGVVFLGCVAAEAIAVLGAVLAAALRVPWLAHLALVFFWFGLVFYLIGLWCFDRRQVAVGAGDQWVAGGALALSAVAGTLLIRAAHSGLYLWNVDDTDVLRSVTIALFALAFVWYCVLATAELRRPRPGYDARRWSTVFPMGMTAVAALSVAGALNASWLRGPGQVLLWIAVAVWCAVLVGAAWSLAGSVRSTARR